MTEPTPDPTLTTREEDVVDRRDTGSAYLVTTTRYAVTESTDPVTGEVTEESRSEMYSITQREWKPGTAEYIAEQNAMTLSTLTVTLEAIQAGTQTVSQADLNALHTRVALICVAYVRGDNSTLY